MDSEQLPRQDQTPEYDPLLKQDAAAEYLSMSPRFLELKRHNGGGPLYVRISSRAIRYFLSDLKSWAQARRRTSTSDPGPENSEENTPLVQSADVQGRSPAAGGHLGVTSADEALS